LRIRKYIEEKGLPQPEFRDYNGFFKAIFYGAEKDVEKISGREVKTKIREVEGEVETKIREVETGVREVEKLTDKQKMILELIKNNPSISKKEMSETIGIRPSSIDKNITTLKEKGYLKRIGPAKGGHWEIINKQKL